MPVSVRSVDDAGLTLSAADEVILDVLFDGRRIWSFWLLRDSRPKGSDRRIAWAAVAGEVPRRRDPARRRRAPLRPGAVRRGDPVRLRHRSDRDRQRRGQAARHRQVGPDGADVRHPQRGARRPAAGLDRGGAGGPGRGRDRGVSGLRHAARRGPRAAPDRARQRRRPRLRQQARAPLRGDPRVVPAAAPARGARLPDHPLQRYRVQGRRGRGRRLGARSRRLRRLPLPRVALPDGRGRYAVPARVDLPAGHLHARGPHPAGAGRAGPDAGGDVRPGLEGARPGLPLRDLAADGAPAQRLVPRHPGLPGRLGAPLQHPPRPASRPRSVRDSRSTSSRRRACRDRSWTSVPAAAATRSGSRSRVPR